MVDWLAYPTELGRAPEAIERVRVVAIDTAEGAAEMYLFRFKTAAPHWVRARVISMYVLVLQGGLALGSAVWGVVASNSSVQFTLTFAAAALTAGLLLAPWYRLQQTTN